MSEAARRHASRGRAAWREQALPGGRCKTHLRLPHRVDRLIKICCRVVAGLLRRLVLAGADGRAQLLADVEDALSLPLLRFVFDDGLAKRCFPVDRVELADRLIKKFVISSVQMVNKLSAGASHGDDVALLPLRCTTALHTVSQEKRVGQALQALGIELLLVAEDNRELLEKKLQDAVETEEGLVLFVECVLKLGGGSTLDGGVELEGGW